MSSVVAFVRAAIMLACLLAVPVLAVTNADLFSWAQQAASRFWNDQAGPSNAGGEKDKANSRRTLRGRPPSTGDSAASRVARVSRPADPIASPLLREPAEEYTASSPTTLPVSIAAGQSTYASNEQAAGDAARMHPPPEPAVADWQEKATALQRLGAVEYALEKWGGSGRLYRFHCKVGMVGGRALARHFQAIDKDGGRAIDRVLHQVRAWRTERQ